MNDTNTPLSEDTLEQESRVPETVVRHIQLVPLLAFAMVLSISLIYFLVL